MGGKDELFFVELLFTGRLDTLSENDLGDIVEEGSGDPVDQPPDEGETTDGNEQEPGDDTEDQGKEDKKDESGSDPAEPEDTGSDDSLDIGEIMERLGLSGMQEDREAVKSLTETIRSLVDVMSMDQYQPGDVYTPPDILIEGYTEWDYPITVEYLINIVGYEEMLPQSAEYDDPDQFLEDFQDMAWNCYQGTVFKDFYIDKVYDAGGGKVYDSQPETEPEPDPGEEEPDEAVDLLLSHLESIDTALAEMQQADLEYYQAVYDYQEEMLEMQKADTGSTIMLCIAVFAVLGELIMKHLLEVFR